MPISNQFITQLVQTFFGIKASVQPLPGDEDENFKITSTSGTHYILKISHPEIARDHLEFLNALSTHLFYKKPSVSTPNTLPAKSGALITEVDIDGTKRYARLVTWIEGRIWATINPKTSFLREELGAKAGMITNSLQDFHHANAKRSFDWNLTNCQWTFKHLDLFHGKEKELVAHFHRHFVEIQDRYGALPMSVIHNDVNNYNILVSEDLEVPQVIGIFDFGDAVLAQTINDAAIVIAYAVMELPDPLEAARDVLSGYHKEYHFSEEEISCLYALVGMRLVTTVTKSALRKAKQTANSYHSISEQPAWDVLEKWAHINPELSTYVFRDACGYLAHPNEKHFTIWAQQQSVVFSDLFPTLKKEDIYLLDLKVSSTWIGSRHEFNNLDLFEFKIQQLQKEHPNKLIADGYLEPRPIYTATSYDKEGNNGPESRSIHLGIDFWLPEETPVHAIFDGEIVAAVNDAGYKEYGGLIIVKHTAETFSFYTLHGHLSLQSIELWGVGDQVQKGDCLGYLGSPQENGEWSPHLHFQVMLTMLDFKIDFPGVAYPAQMDIWGSLCPDPNLLFKNEHLKTVYDMPSEEIHSYREQHMGKGLSVSYQKPLHMVRGDGAHLLDPFGRKYLDTVNNVAHVGHEHPKVVEAGQKQMALLNTNSRYLNQEMISYAASLLKTLPKELSVLHFVNSGSEANELAIRMAKTVTQREQMLAIEIGYHGNTNAVIDVSSYKFDGKGGKGKPAHTHILPMPDPYRGIHLGEDSGPKYAQYAKEILKTADSEGTQIAAFIGEPIISCGGQILPPKNYFKEVYKHVREFGGLCIADEVQTGFGRVGTHFWAFQLHDVIPDIVTMGKPAGNGHPLAIVACTRDVAKAFANGMEFFNTFGGNPVSCAIGRKVLEVIENEDLQQNALEVGSFLKESLQLLQKEFPMIGEVRGKGLFLGFELVTSEKKPMKAQATYLVNRMKDFKILMSTDGRDHNVIKIKPPMIFSLDHAKELIFRLQQVFKEDFMKL